MLYGVAHRLLRAVLPRYFEWKCEGAHHLPEDGAAIVVCNHVNYLDPLVMGVISRRPLHFMAKKELFDIPIFGWLLRKAYAFPVRRGQSDRQAIRHALKILQEGHVLALFPEGTRSRTGTLQELQRGAAMLAIRSKAPVIPMVILGAHEALAGRRLLPRRVPITVRIGAPLTFDYPVSNSETITAASQQIHRAMAALYEQGGGDGSSFVGADKALTGRKTYRAEEKKV